MGRVAIEDGGVTVADLARVVQHDDLGEEVGSSLGRVVLGVTSDESTAQFLDGHVLDVEADVVTRDGLLKGFVVHFDGLDFSGQLAGGESDDGAGLDDTSFNTADGDCADTTDLVDVLEGQTQRLLGRAARGQDSIQSFQQGLA